MRTEERDIEGSNKKSIMRSIMEERKKHGLKRGDLKEAFSGIKAGGMRTFPIDEVNVASFRSRASQINMVAGHTKYSVSVDKVTGTMRLLNNG